MMTGPRCLAVPSLLGATAIACVTPTAQAGNGLNDVGYGTESAAMAGADLALARDTAALNTNPAGLAQIESQALNLLLEPYSYLDTSHRDARGNSGGPDNQLGVAVGGGYARRIGTGPVVVGVGMFFQGGSGFTYKKFHPPVPGVAPDELSALTGSVKIAPGLAWQLNEQWSLGAAVGLLYSSARQKAFPDTSTPEISGLRIDKLHGISANLKVGMQYRPSDDWVLALAYTSKTPIRLENGTLRIDHTGSGGTVVRYDDVTLKGLGFAPELGVGLRYRVNTQWTLVADLTWLEWSATMRKTTLSARGPDDPAAPVLEVVTPLDWRDQYLGAIGALYQWSEQTELRAGFSYARQPIPKHALDPLLAVTGESSLTAGFARRLDSGWEFSGAAAWQPPVNTQYESAAYGTSRERWQGVVIYASVNRFW